MRIKIILGLVALLFTVLAQGQTAPVSGSDKTLRVAVKPSPPFVIKDKDGGYEGISVQLWEQIASEHDIRFKYTEENLQGMIDGVADGKYDVGVGAVTVTAEREARLDFSQPFFDSGLAIAVRNDDRSGWWAVVSNAR